MHKIPSDIESQFTFIGSIVSHGHEIAKSYARETRCCWLFAKQFLLHLFLFSCIIKRCHAGKSAHNSAHSIYTPDVIQEIIETSCFVAFSVNDPSLSSVFEDVEFAYKADETVIIGHVDFSGDAFTKKTKTQLKVINPLENNVSRIVVFPRRKLDRSCLLYGLRRPRAVGETYTGLNTLSSVLFFINQKCHTYRQKTGFLNAEGLHREEILRTLFHVENVTDVGMKDITSYCTRKTCQDFKIIHSHSSFYQQQSKSKQIKSTEMTIHKCDKINIPSKTDFFHDYLKISKPVIIKNAMENWPAIEKWSNDYFRTHYGKEKVHIKLTPQGVFEGVDFASEFENYESFKVPLDVQKQLKFPDLVVVRPAMKNMNFSDFIDLIESVSDGRTRGISAYLEYSSLSDIVAELEHDVLEMPFIDHMLKLEHLNMWLSDGKTLGKLHFDPFDNFLCQISGKKEVVLFSPHDNTKLYEAHIPEAMLAYDNTTQTFVKKTLMDSTSMVMSPVDLSNPNYKRFPKFAEAYPMNCTIEEGEVLFMPAFWWHEVQSYPSLTEKRNLAVNFWYDPFLTKEFPCQECKLDVNPNYRHLL